MSRYEVKAVKSFRGREGHGFNANLYRDGKKVATVDDSANGGCFDWHWLDFKAEKVSVDVVTSMGEPFTRKCTPEEALFVKHIEGMTYFCEYSKKDVKKDEDFVVSEMVEEFENNKRFKRICKTKTMLKLKSDAEGAFSTFSVKFVEGAKEKLEEWAKKNGEEIIEFVNERYVA